MKRGSIEYRVRWRRSPVGPWKFRLFQEEYAAKRFASFLLRPDAKIRATDDESGYVEDYPVPPIVDIVIQMREVAVWADSGIDTSQLPKYVRHPVY